MLGRSSSSSWPVCLIDHGEVKIVRSDDGGEFTGNALYTRVCSPPDQAGINFTSVDSPQYNDTAEPTLGLIGTTLLAARLQARLVFPGPGVPTREDLWAEVMAWAVDSLNRGDHRKPGPYLPLQAVTRKGATAEGSAVPHSMLPQEGRASKEALSAGSSRSQPWTRSQRPARLHAGAWSFRENHQSPAYHLAGSSNAHDRPMLLL